MLGAGVAISDQLKAEIWLEAVPSKTATIKRGHYHDWLEVILATGEDVYRMDRCHQGARGAEMTAIKQRKPGQLSRFPVTIEPGWYAIFERGQLEIDNPVTRREFYREQKIPDRAISALNREWHRCQTALARYNKLMSSEPCGPDQTSSSRC